MKALIIGATGAVGRDLVALLLNDPAFSRVVLFVRRDPGISDPKLVVNIVDFDKPDLWKDKIEGDIAFSCLGTTLRSSGSKNIQYKVDYTYQYNFAKAASENNVPNYFLVSAFGANPSSRFFYTRIKGELEDAVQNLKFKNLCIFRAPALIRKNTDRLTEKISVPVIKFLNRFGMLTDQAPMETKTLAEAMVNISKFYIENTIIKPSEIKYFSRH